MADQHFTSSVEPARAKSWQTVLIARIDFISSMTEALISEVFKRPVLLDHRIKDYHNRGFVDKEWRNLSQTLKFGSKYYYIAFVFGLYTNLCTDMQNWFQVIKLCNDGFELLRFSNGFLLPRYRTSWTVEIFTK
jgi:hypothetical protein